MKIHNEIRAVVRIDRNEDDKREFWHDVPLQEVHDQVSKAFPPGTKLGGFTLKDIRCRRDPREQAVSEYEAELLFVRETQ